MKCSKCKHEYTEEQMTKVGKKHYCNDCYDNYYLPEVEDWSTLFENIKGRNNLKTLPISTITLLKRYHNDDTLSYIGMSLTYDYIKSYLNIKESSNYCQNRYLHWFRKAKGYCSKCKLYFCNDCLTQHNTNNPSHYITPYPIELDSGICPKHNIKKKKI